MKGYTEGPWEYFTDEKTGDFGVKISGGHDILYDLEGACDECFANMKAISMVPEMIKVLQNVYHDDGSSCLSKETSIALESIMIMMRDVA